MEAGPSIKYSEMSFDMYSTNLLGIIIACGIGIEISHDFIHLAIVKFEHDQFPVPDTV